MSVRKTGAPAEKRNGEGRGAVSTRPARAAVLAPEADGRNGKLAPFAGIAPPVRVTFKVPTMALTVPPQVLLALP